MALSKAHALSLEDCHCPLCMEFLTEPVTLPCNHTMCKLCFKALLRKAFLSCPFCRTWNTSWAQTHTHVNGFINEELWERIQAQYPEECRQRVTEDELLPLVFRTNSPVQVISNPGELRKEYEEEMIRMEAERQATEERQNRATQEYIRQLLAKDLEEEKLWAEKYKLNKQPQREEEKAKKHSISDPGTSPRKKKSKQKHCDNVPKISPLWSQFESVPQYKGVQDGKKISEKTDSDGKSPMAQGNKTKGNLPAATLSRSSVIPKQGTLSPHYTYSYNYDVKVDSSEDDAPKPSCSKQNVYVPIKKIKSEATAAQSFAQTGSGSTGSGMRKEIGNKAIEAKDKMCPPLGRKHTSKRKHQESDEASESGTFHEMPLTYFSDEEETQFFITQKMIDLENMYFEKHQQEEQDRLFALELQRALDEEVRGMSGEKPPWEYSHDYNDFPPATSSKGDWKDKNI
ncbi:E3 ubiquitin-protein ligase RNF168-like [Acomys russatus]|uniref:E3 ubiquitin-protein ligase RNF168-like n=1 Tax=Acomys russatus TaxID=60746 RepID=UPI0021E1E658|nr:E3 ubiquitin-protein ligase RNF168-like [Acomys russatus]